MIFKWLVLVSGWLILLFWFSADNIFIIVNYFLFVDGLGQASHHHYQYGDSKYDKDEIVVQRKAETISQWDRVDTARKHWSYCPV